jgi:peptidoglycan-associated lipoprotein
MALGEKRAKAAYDVLTRYGINASRMETISFGREKLANPNCAMDPATKDSCEALNRRVEYTIIKN